MLERLQVFLQPALVPTRVAGVAEEDGPLVVVDAVDLPTAGVEERADFRTDEP
jgi:hypothetical protein